MKLSMIEKALFCFIGTFWFVWGINLIGDTVVQAGPLKTAVFKAVAETAKPAAGAAADTAKSAPGALAMLATADAAAGKEDGLHGTPVITTGQLVVLGKQRDLRRATEFAGHHDERILQFTTLVQII